MDYKKKYEEALSKASRIKDYNTIATPQEVAELLFPELKESENERIRKWIVDELKDSLHTIEATYSGDYDNRDKDDIIREGYLRKALAWLEKQDKNEEINEASYRTDIKRVLDNPESYGLEKQGEQKSTDKVEPKFHEGEWVLIEEVKGYKNGPFQIKNVDSFGYSFDEYHTIPFMYKDLLSKWTILDAKPGDVLTTDNGVCIFDGTLEEGKYPFAYCGITKRGFESYDGNLPFSHDNNIHPATKEQRDFLFQKMREAGYEWDDKKLELKKVEQNPAWSEEDEVCCSDVNAAISDYFDEGYAEELKDWLKSLKDRMKGE